VWEKKQPYWEGLAVGYFFLAALGAMTFVVAALLDLSGVGVTSAINGWISLAAVVVTGIGSLCLMLELGNKFKFFLVFTNPSSIMSIGAYFLSLFMVMAFIYATFFFDFIPWYDTGTSGLRTFIAVIGMIAALVLVTYPGLELGEARGRTFWNGSALVPLFFISGSTTGLAGVMLGAVMLGQGDAPAILVLDKILLGFLMALLVFILGYLIDMKHSGREASVRAVQIILHGLYKNTFYGGMILIGIILPLAMYLLGVNPGVLAVKALFVIIGAACFRSVFIQAAVRIGLPGEDREWYEEKELLAFADRLEKRWQEKKTWLYPE